MKHSRKHALKFIIPMIVFAALMGAAAIYSFASESVFGGIVFLMITGAASLAAVLANEVNLSE